MAETDSTAPQLTDEERAQLTGMSKLWWMWLVTGILWLFIALIVLQFDTASVDTVGLIVGAMFLFTGVQQLFAVSVVDGWKWVYALFGVLFLIAGVWVIFNPGRTVAALADWLGFLFLLVAIFWIVEAFALRGSSDLWWLGLLTGILMGIIAFWTSGQFFIEKVYILLVFAGIWALMQGITDIVRSFQIRKLGKLAAS